MPRSGAGLSIGRSHMRALPRVAFSKPATMRSKVDLPQPEAPIRQTNSPLFTRRFASRSASMRSPSNSNCLLKPFSSRIGTVASDMVRAPAQQTLAEPHHDAVGKEARDADHDHAGDDDLGARQLPRFHDDRAEPRLHAGHLADHNHHPGEAKTQSKSGEDRRKTCRQ